jgi:hypothetical protein
MNGMTLSEGLFIDEFAFVSALTQEAELKALREAQAQLNQQVRAQQTQVAHQTRKQNVMEDRISQHQVCTLCVCLSVWVYAIYCACICVRVWV